MWQRGFRVKPTPQSFMVVPNVQCVRETETLVEQQPPQGVFVCDHAGLATNLKHLHQLEKPVMKRKAVVALCGNEDPTVGLYLGS